MNDDFDYDPDFLDDDEIAAPPRAPAAPTAKALVVEDDAALTGICVQRLSRVGIRAEVVWTREEALAALSRSADALAFVYADSRLLGATCAGAAAEIRRLRPSTPFVVASRSLADVLSSDGVVICKSFDEDQFQAAFDVALLDEESRRVLLDAADVVRLHEAADAAAFDALPEIVRASLQLSA